MEDMKITQRHLIAEMCFNHPNKIINICNKYYCYVPLRKSIMVYSVRSQIWKESSDLNLAWKQLYYYDGAPFSNRHIWSYSDNDHKIDMDEDLPF